MNNFADLSGQITFNSNPAAQVYIPRIQQALPGDKQAYCLEEFKYFVKSFYDVGQNSFTNGLMNRVQNDLFKPLVNTYLHCLANANAQQQQNFNNEAWRKNLALSVIILSQPGQAYCEQVKMDTNNNGPQWYANTANCMRNINMGEFIARNIQRMQQLDSGMGMNNNGMGNNGMGMGNVQQQNNGLRPNDFNSGGMTTNNNGNGRTLGDAMREQSSGHAAMPTPSNSYADKMMADFAGSTGLPKTQPQQQVQQTQQPVSSNPLIAAAQAAERGTTVMEMSAPVVEAEPTSTVGEPQYISVESGIINNADGSISINPKHPDYTKIYRARYAKKAGWAVNVQPPYYNLSDYSDFDSYRWMTKYGEVTQDNIFEATALTGFGPIMEAYKKRQLDLEMTIAERFPQYDNIADVPEYQFELEDIIKKQNAELRDLYFGSLLGPQVLNTETNPWCVDSMSAAQALDKVLSPTIQRTLEDEDLLLVNLFNREYYMVDSRKPYVNELMVQARNEIDPMRWTHRDDESIAGHYYLINPYAVRDGRELVIEDFYDLGEYMIDVKRYLCKPASEAVWKGEDDDGQEFFIPGATEAELRSIEMKHTFHNITPLAAADAVRDVLHARRHSEWDGSIVYGSTVEDTTWVVTCTERDRRFWRNFQTALTNRDILDIKSLGEFLAKAVEDTTITQRLIRMIDGRIMKEMNVLFNDVLGFNPTVIIEESFIKEYEDLLEIINDSSTPVMARAMFGRGVTNLLTSLTESELTEEDIAAYKLNCPFEIKGTKINFGNKHEVEIKDAVHALKTTTAVAILPFTTNALGINVHSNEATVSWNHLPAEVHAILTDHVFTPNMKTVLVTSDNYTLALNGANDVIMSGIITAAR